MAAFNYAFGVEAAFASYMLATVALFLPIVGPISVMGWHAQGMQKLARGEPGPGSKYDFGKLGDYMKSGVPLFGARFVMALPISLFFSFGIMAMALVLMIGSRSGNQDESSALVVGLTALMALLGSLAVMVFMPFFTGVNVLSMLSEDVGYSISPGRILHLVKPIYFKALVASVLFAMAASGVAMVGMMLLFIGVYPAIGIVQTAKMHLDFQLYELARYRGADAVRMKGVAQVAYPVPIV